MIALAHSEATASTLSSSRVVNALQKKAASPAALKEQRGQGSPAFVNTTQEHSRGHRSVQLARVFPKYVIQKLVLILFQK